MPVIQHTVSIQAPVERCFDLARNVDVHTQTTAATKEKAVGGVTTGLLKLGDEVVWEALHFGVKQRLTARIIEMEAPRRFVDVMVKGAFDSFVHQHEFIGRPDGSTLMVDNFEYKSPLGVLGKLADRLFLERYMRRFLKERALALKELAEGNRSFS
ncbi:SRPBCC family protein [Paenibacillus gansuensis]|uniref:SRPBCC family protein n=1 Tax=Paenibacillus gansuensis TaxID=306542 RepID=A0ABW5PHV2_9BACL